MNRLITQKDRCALIAQVLQVKKEDIREVCLLKKGMTNHSYLFECAGKKYMVRIPGEGTDRLIDRRAEAEIYQAIAGRGIGDKCLYMEPDSGYKITEYLEPSRVCNPENMEEVGRCMKVLRDFHEMKLHADHEFSIFRQIDFYEALWENQASCYPDYADIKRAVFSLKPYIDAHVADKVLTHIDAVSDNFLFHQEESGAEKVYLIDWEYAGMQDPHVDVAMFGIYAGYGKSRMDKLIDIYFEGKCSEENRIKIYAYVAACGLLWSNWCEFKMSLGVYSGEYALRQYQYARDYFGIVRGMLGEEKGKWGIL